MSNQNPTPSTVQRGLLVNKTPPKLLSELDLVCTVGAQCPEVQASPFAVHALSLLQGAVTTAQGSLQNRQLLGQALMVAIKTLNTDIGAVKDALAGYQAAIVIVAKKDATLINKAGLKARAERVTPVALGIVIGVTSKLGKLAKEAIANWPAAPGAIGYALEVNYTPENPAGPWTGLVSGASRRRTVKTPTPSAQLLLRVAALGNGDQQSEWSDPILVTTR